MPDFFSRSLTHHESGSFFLLIFPQKTMCKNRSYTDYTPYITMDWGKIFDHSVCPSEKDTVSARLRCARAVSFSPGQEVSG